ncbi:peptidoglycan D,D-transpeptidase FtsI family protein [Belnapia rosea]|uniref:peptidoglycan D,D-transpeptidase FtsI family protein n=1 Tax=Belnapia rosea TaxID=938405 RepID=UPI00088E046E|nr:penicillin-binding protein 2 [Belnapia rosea]SDB52635.1 cell division protein FtsI (penicillin-binding protein 3) [Belnapia rosea]
MNDSHDELRPPPSPDAAPAGRPRPGSLTATSSRALVRIAAPELARRAQLDKTRGRLVIAAGGFALLFGAVSLKLAFATLFDPMVPKPRAAVRIPTGEPNVGRAAITDRNGEVLAVSLQVTELYANPQEINDPQAAAEKLLTVLPNLDRERLVARISPRMVPGTERPVEFAYIARNLPPRQQQAINDLGIAGFHFRPAERRFYPQGSAAAHVLGQVDVDGRGIAGVERSFDERLRVDRSPLRLSIDVRVQVALREAVQKAIADYNGIGGAGVLMDINTAEVLAMVSLPDYDASDPGGLQRRQDVTAANGQPMARQVVARPAVPTVVKQDQDPHFNRATVGLYEPGSTFKLLTAAMALDAGSANIWSSFDASRPIRYGRFTISDYKGKNRVLSLPEVLAYSSNLGAAHMALGVGPARHREFMGRMGMLQRLGVELPETARPLAPTANGWRDINTMTVSFGHGISVTPLHVVTGVSALANGGILRTPTLVAQSPDSQREGTRVISERTSETMRRLMRLVVTDGSGKGADVPGYFVGGKTGTAQKVGPRGGYLQDKRIAAFVGAFPLNAPRYALYVMVDEPKPNAQSHGYATAGWVAAPAAGAVIRRVAPILGMVPETDRIPQIQQTLSIPLQPGRPARPSPPVATAPQAPAPRGTPAATPAAPPASGVAPAPTLVPPAPTLRRTEAEPPAGLLRFAVGPASPREAGLAPR